MGFELIGTGHYVPGTPVTNADLARVMHTDDEWIFKRSGIRQRHYAPDGIGASDLGVEAAKRAIEAAGIDKHEIDYIVFATMTPDHIFPGPGALLSAKLGLDHVPALDIRQQCAAMIFGLQVINGLIAGGTAKTILFVGTKRQAKDVVRESARAVGMPFVAERWLGGTLTNFETIRSSIRRLDAIESQISRPDYMRESKKAQARDGRERRRILRNLEGVRTMGKLPDAIFVVDPKHEITAVKEAMRMGIQVIGLVDSDTDPALVNLAIPGNDDGIRSIQVVLRVLVDGINKGRSDTVTVAPKVDEAVAK